MLLLTKFLWFPCQMTAVCGIKIIWSCVSKASGNSWDVLFCFVRLFLCICQHLYCVPCTQTKLSWDRSGRMSALHTVYLLSGLKLCSSKSLHLFPPNSFSTWYSSYCQMFFLFLLQLMSAGVGQYPSLYSTPVQSESGKWDALVKASESLLKEKELIIERQVFLLLMEGTGSLCHLIQWLDTVVLYILFLTLKTIVLVTQNIKSLLFQEWI